MNTTELKKLAEAATQGETKASGNGVHIRTRCVLTTHMEPPEQRQADARFYAAANPAAILKLLAINAELVEALKEFGVHTRDCGVNNYRFNSSCTCGLDSTVAKAEGGEL